MSLSDDFTPPKKKLTKAQALPKIYRFCSYQERAHQEVKQKLFDLGLYASEVDELLSQLITDGFLNEERFAKAFAGGKFRMKRWGRLKIVHELEAKGLTKNCIKAGLKEIDDEDYHHALAEVLEKQSARVDEADDFVRRDKIARYAIQRGFEPDLVWKMVKEKY
jgi:regulatory protein